MVLAFLLTQEFRWNSTPSVHIAQKALNSHRNLGGGIKNPLKMRLSEMGQSEFHRFRFCGLVQRRRDLWQVLSRSSEGLETLSAERRLDVS